MSTEKRDNQQEVVLSELCYQCLRDIQDVYYGLAFTLFTLKEYRTIRDKRRRMSPDFQKQGDWVRVSFENIKLALSLSDNAVNRYTTTLKESQFFGSAVKSISIYEDYLNKIIEIAEQKIPKQMNQFRINHDIESTRIKARKRFWSEENGRGITFLHEVFGWNPLPRYQPGLKLWFHLRNLSIHNSGIADDKLCQFARDPYIVCDDAGKVGNKVSWYIGNTLSVIELVRLILQDADPSVFTILGIPTLKQRPFWHIDNTLS